MLKHLNDFYKGFKFKTAIKEARADKNDKTMVEFYEKANFKAKIPTTIIFDKTGKLLRTIDADPEMATPNVKGNEKDDLDKYYAKMNMSLEEKANSASAIPENIQKRASTMAVLIPCFLTVLPSFPFPVHITMLFIIIELLPALLLFRPSSA